MEIRYKLSDSKLYKIFKIANWSRMVVGMYLVCALTLTKNELEEIGK